MASHHLGLFVAGAVVANASMVVVPALMQHWAHETVPGFPSIPLPGQPPLSELLLRKVAPTLERNAKVVGAVLAVEAMKAGMDSISARRRHHTI